MDLCNAIPMIGDAPLAKNLLFAMITFLLYHDQLILIKMNKNSFSQIISLWEGVVVLKGPILV
jgi:hypothetical protein